jgi:hypothetical protein
MGRPGGRGERLQGVLDELGRQLADARVPEGQVDDRVRPAPDVDDGRRDRLVHRDAGIAEAADARPVTERLGDRRPEDQRDVLDGVVLVDLQVAARRHLQVEQAVMRERGQQVVVEADAGRDRRPPAAIQVEPDGDVGLARLARDRHRTAVTVADVVRTQGGGHGGPISRAAASSRSSSSGERTVSRR